MRFEDLSAEAKEKALGCRTPEELLDLARNEGVELSDEELSYISGGGWTQPSCPDDTAWTYVC